MLIKDFKIYGAPVYKCWNRSQMTSFHENQGKGSSLGPTFECGKEEKSFLVCVWLDSTLEFCLSLTHDVDYIIPPAIRHERRHLAVLHPAHVRRPLPERLPLHVDAVLSDEPVPALASGVLAGTGALAVILGVGRVQLVGNARLGHGFLLKSNNKLRGGEDGRRMEEERERTLCLEEEHNKDENYGNDRSSENAPLPQHNHPTTTRQQASPYL